MPHLDELTRVRTIGAHTVPASVPSRTHVAAPAAANDDARIQTHWTRILHCDLGEGAAHGEAAAWTPRLPRLRNGAFALALVFMACLVAATAIRVLATPAHVDVARFITSSGAQPSAAGTPERVVPPLPGGSFGVVGSLRNDARDCSAGVTAGSSCICL